uniref:Transposase (Putative), gypsy type n=1 Tax=Tanacetum cinerariifolium TaxID=118510 RepID=A0A699HDU2_TANCI|nr:hypothetical protein [Tanacetum cinerariifolium]
MSLETLFRNQLSADDYDVLVAHPAQFWKFSEPFHCLIGMSCNYTLDEDTYPTFLRDDGTEMNLFTFIQVADPTKVKVGEWEHAEEETRLLDSIVRRVVPLLLIALARVESELEASVERLFDEGGSTNHEDSAAGGGQDAGTGLATGVKIVVAEDVAAEKPKRPCNKRQAVTDASGSSHPPKKLRGDYGTSGEVATSGKSLYALKELLASSMLNDEASVMVVRTLPMVTSLVSATPKHESGALDDSITGANLRIIGASKRFVISSDSSHHCGTNVFGDEDDSIIRSVVVPPVMTEAVVTSHADFDSTKTVKADAAGPSYLARQDLLMGSWELDAETMHQIREMDYHHLFMKFKVGTTRQACLNAEVRMRTEYCLKTEAAEATHLHAQVSAAEAMEKILTNEINALKQKNVALENEKESLDGKFAEIQSSVSTKHLELKDLNVSVSSLRSQKDGLVDQVHALDTICFGLCDQVAKLDADLLEMALHLEEIFNPHLLTTISCQRWLLTYGLKLVVVKCLNSQGYLSALGAAVSCAIEKVMQNELSADIDHGKAGRSLADVVAYNPATEANYNSALQRLREVDFPLLAELKSYKDASVEDIMNLLRLEGPLVDAQGMNDLQPDKNVAAKRSALIGVWTPLVDPLSVENLVGESDTSDGVPTIIATTTAMSTTFASASSIPTITIEDYEIVGTDGLKDAQGSDQGNVASLPTVEIEKEELYTTLELIHLAELIL